MRLVKVGQISDREWQVLAWENFPYTGSELAQNRSLPDYLGSKIQEFASPLNNVDLWASVPPTHLDIRLLKIPKVPRKQVHSAIRWMARKEAALDLQENLLDFEIHGEVIDKGVTKLAVLAYKIPKEEVKYWRRIGTQPETAVLKSARVWRGRTGALPCRTERAGVRAHPAGPNQCVHLMCSFLCCHVSVIFFDSLSPPG